MVVSDLFQLKHLLLAPVHDLFQPAVLLQQGLHEAERLLLLNAVDSDCLFVCFFI